MNKMEDAVNLFSSAVNNFNDENNAKEFVKAMSNQHRTLQQSMMRVFIAWIQHNASLEENWYDARNEGTVKFCKEVVKHFEENPELSMYLRTI